MGTLVGVRTVQIQGGKDSNVIGTIGGAILGGLLGNSVGSGSGRNPATAAGGVAGSNLEDTLNRTQGVELKVRKDDGNTIMVAQTQGNTCFSVGQRVALVSNCYTIIVSPR